MARVTIEHCLEKVGSHFDLVLLAVERAKQISNGKKSEILKKGIKTHVTALREIEEGTLSITSIRKDLVNYLHNTNARDENLPTDNTDIIEEMQSSEFIHGELEDFRNEENLKFETDSDDDTELFDDDNEIEENLEKNN